jgi:hypothetical protein
MRATALVALSFASISLLAVTSGARAFCRTTTVDAAPTCPVTECVTAGIPLAWPTAHITYWFNDQGFPEFTSEQERSIIETSFGAWTAVTCPSSTGAAFSVGLDLEAAAGTTPLTVGPESAEPDKSVIAWLSASDWETRDFDPLAFALTSIWFDKNSGRILDADMHFNGAMQFGTCPAQVGCPRREQIADLQNVATHEAGHFLGLSHSDKSGSTMWCNADFGEVDKRTLSPDDVNGLCAVYPPAEAFPDDRGSMMVQASSGCALTAQGGTSGAAWACSLLLGLLLRRRRRR